VLVTSSGRENKCSLQADRSLELPELVSSPEPYGIIL
jgi:hypothetical protein